MGGDIFGNLAIAGAFLYKLISGNAVTSATDAIAIGLLGILLVLSTNVDSLRSLTFDKDGFKVELDQLEKKTSENDRAITDLILLSMGEHTYGNLRKLANGTFGHYDKEHFMGLETELYHLRNLEASMKLRSVRVASSVSRDLTEASRFPRRRFFDS